MAIEFFHTSVSPEAVSLATRTLMSTWLSEGRRVKEFEDALSDRLGLVNPAALNSGTSALHLALVIANVGPGDEVILPPQTFIATGLAIVMQGAVPVFADVDPCTGNLLPESVAAKVTSRTRAVMPVHWAGLPCDMDDIQDIASRHGLAVVEDAAHALGAAYHGSPIGGLSRFTAFSFQAIKHLTTGDGGALCCTDANDARQVMARRWFGIDRANSPMSVLGEREYDLDTVGYKYHMNDLAAAVGLGNLQDFPQRLARRRLVAARYLDALSGVHGLELPPCPSDRESAWWLFQLRVDRREDFIRALASRWVPASVVHQRIDRNRVFGGVRSDLFGQAEFDMRQVSIPVHEGLSDADVAQVVDAVRAGW